MSRLAALATAPLLAVVACSKPLPPPVHYARTVDAKQQECRATGSEYACEEAGKWLELQRHDDEALAMFRRGCRAGGVLSCWGVLRHADDLDAHWTLCSHPVYGSWPQCRIWLATVPTAEPRRVALIEQQCSLTRDCALALTTLLALDAPARDWATRTCAAPAPDEPTCAAMVQVAWPDPALGLAVRKTIEQRGCAPGVGALCLAAAEPGLLADAPADVAAARELVRRGCELGASNACGRQETLVQRDAWFSSCKRGDVEGCQALGADIARRRAEAGLDPR